MLGYNIETLFVFFGVDIREHRQNICIRGRALDREFEARAHRRVLFYTEVGDVAEAAQDGFVGSERLRCFAAERFRHGVQQDTMHIRDRRDDARRQIILQRENVFRTKRTIIRLGPQMSSTVCVDKLD